MAENGMRELKISTKYEHYKAKKKKERRKLKTQRTVRKSYSRKDKYYNRFKRYLK